MLEALKFVQGAVAKKDFVPALTHFRIESGVIQGYNGAIAISSPIDLDISVMPRAEPFTKAIQTCKETVAMHITSTNRLAIKSGKFKAFVDCTDEAFPDIQPEGDYIELTGGIISTLKVMAPFIAQDASRPWAAGILLKGASAFATNNIILLEAWLGYHFPVDVNIPAQTVKELLRIKEDPIGLQVTDRSITFHFKDGRWMRSQLSTLDWPDIGRVLDKPSEQIPFPDGFFEAVEELEPFTDELDRVHLFDGAVSTFVDEGGSGATIEVPGTLAGGCYQARQLLLLKDMAKTIDLTQYPAPSIFIGDNYRGAIVGMRV